MTTSINPEELRRLLRERCLTGEQLRRRTGLSPTTLAKLNRGTAVSDGVFRRVVLELQEHPVVPLAQQLATNGSNYDRRQEKAE
jgi:transcriptional regulator with XRE-family HTH domain